MESPGRLLAVLVTAAAGDAAAAAPGVRRQLEGIPLTELRKVYADTQYHNHALDGWGDESGF